MNKPSKAKQVVDTLLEAEPSPQYYLNQLPPAKACVATLGDFYSGFYPCSGRLRKLTPEEIEDYRSKLEFGVGGYIDEPDKALICDTCGTVYRHTTQPAGTNRP